jgi:hypothetical protein
MIERRRCGKIRYWHNVATEIICGGDENRTSSCGLSILEKI